MQTDEREITPEESLSLIRSMIETTKHSIGDSSHYFLLWGWAVMIGCLVQYILMSVVKSPYHYLAWLITPVAVIFHVIFMLRDRRKERVKTFISEATGYLWTALGLSFFALAFIFSKIGWVYCFPIYILLYGVGTYVSGSILKFKPLVVGGLVNLLLAIITAYLPYDVQILMTAVAILISYIIPGHLLRLHTSETNLS